MFRAFTKLTVALGIAGASLFGFAGASFASGAFVEFAPATFAVTGASTSVPYGWVDFCQRYRAECADDDRHAAEVDLTPAMMRKIARVNAWVNKTVKPLSDMEHWGVADQWDYPTDGYGDCEDYALLKRKMLIEEGLPRQALLVTVVKDKNADGHAILTIRTNHGDYVLDNLADEVKPWASTPYRYVKRQSQVNQNVWVMIGPPTREPLYVSK
jgi:predicted transglutaminase-like cysteine proteinase